MNRATAPGHPVDPSSLPVVVGVDGSTDSEGALLWAAAEARARGTRLRIVHAWMPPPVALTTPTVPTVLVDHSVFESEAIRVVDAASTLVRQAAGAYGPVIEVRVTAGPAVPALMDASSDAGLLVVGSHGRHGLARLSLGSIAEDCLRTAPVPVVVVREGTPVGTTGPVVVGVDGSPAAREALRWAALEAGRLRRRLVVVHAEDVEAVLREDRDLLPAGIEAVIDHAGRRFLDHLLADVAVINGRPRSVAWRVVTGKADEVLTEASAGASMLVLGVPHPHGLAERIFGSTASHCVGTARCPVVVVSSSEPPADDVPCAS